MSDHIQPEGLFPGVRLGFTQVVSAAADRLVWVAGQTACDEHGRPLGGDDVAEQASAALANLGRALAAAGARPGDVTMLRVHVVGLDRDTARRIAVPVAQFFAGTSPPASTWIGVQSLIDPSFLVEIDAVAAPNAVETLL
jgi:enamine deaminase RidA (YjgF/YER057c/UK114 family)